MKIQFVYIALRLLLLLAIAIVITYCYYIWFVLLITLMKRWEYGIRGLWRRFACTMDNIRYSNVDLAYKLFFSLCWLCRRAHYSNCWFICGSCFIETSNVSFECDANRRITWKMLKNLSDLFVSCIASECEWIELGTCTRYSCILSFLPNSVQRSFSSDGYCVVCVCCVNDDSISHETRIFCGDYLSTCPRNSL